MEVISATRNKQIDHDITVQELMKESTGEDIDFENIEEKTYTDEERWNYAENNKENVPSGDYTEERYDDGEYKGFKYERVLGNIEDAVAEEVALTMEEIDSSDKLFTKNGDLYELNIPVMDEEQLKEMTESQSGDEPLDYVCEFYLTLPAPAESHNATSVSEDGLTYTWDLLNTQTINASFKTNKTVKVAENTENAETTPQNVGNNEEVTEGSNNYVTIVAIVAVIIILGIAVFASKKK